MIHASLVRFDEHMRVEGELAESWSIHGYRDFRFKLRSGLKFQDGTPLSAEDVVRVLHEFKDGRSPLAVALAHVNNISTEGALVVRVETDSPQPFLLNDFPAFKIFKRKGKVLVAAGRYRMTRETPADIHVEAADTYYQPLAAGAFSEITFKYVSDDNTRYQYLVRGDGNVVLSGISLTKTGYLRQHRPKEMQILDSPGVNVSYICFNFKEPHLANLKVRQAIAQAIDIPGILKFRIGGFGSRATGILAPAHGDYYEPEVEHQPFDRENAERLLDQAGYPRKSPGGWRFKLTFKTTTEKFGNEMARLLANEIRQAGIDVQLDVVEAGTFFADINAGNFQLFHSRWIGVTSPAIYFRALHSSQAHGGLNRGSYSNQEFDRLVDKGMTEVDDAKRRKYFSEVQKVAARDLPYVSLWHWSNTFIGTRSMRNVVMYPNGDYRTLADVRIADGGEK
ncbi:MAG: ABC transporter substrate-binding protein [Deltaproteobacteria bacterium]|nr:ABC transporter substrate-binding protein [Deltaproteobacteria bacterium]